jgi:predicted transporter
MAFLISVYLITGVAFGVAFVLVGFRKIDPSAENVGFLVRLLWLPGALVLWPYLLPKWIRSQKK